MKILVVDDKKQSRLILDHFLRQKGMVHTASDGKEALEYFKQSLQKKDFYDFFFLDIRMDGMDGHTLLVKLKSFVRKYYPEPNNRRFVLVTALADSNNIIKGFREGCDSYLIKPITWEKLDEVFEHFAATN